MFAKLSPSLPLPQTAVWVTHNAILLPTFQKWKVIPSLQPYLPYREGADFRLCKHSAISCTALVYR